MRKPLSRFLARIDALSLRERVLVFATLLLGVSAVWYLGFLSPLQDRGRTTVEELHAIGARIEAAEAALSLQAGALGELPGVSLAERLEQVSRRASQLDALLETHAAQLIDPAEMARMLREVLEHQRGLRLIRARNLQAEPLLADGEGVRLYRHGLELELEGPYLAVLEYLDALEALPWRLYWQAIEIDAEDYPRNRVLIEVSTLSLDEEWIGV